MAGADLSREAERAIRAIGPRTTDGAVRVCHTLRARREGYSQSPSGICWLPLVCLLAAAALTLSGCAGDEPGLSAPTPSTHFDATRGNHHWVVWVDSQHEWRLDEQSVVRAFDLESGTERTCSQAPSTKLSPRVSDRWVVWLDGRSDPTPLTGDSQMDLYCYDLATGQERRLTYGADIDQAPALAGALLAWAAPPQRSQSQSGAYEAALVTLDLLSGRRHEYRVPGTYPVAPVISLDWPPMLAFWSVRVDPQMSEISVADLQVVDLQAESRRSIPTDIAQPGQYRLSLSVDSPRFVWQQIRPPSEGRDSQQQLMLGRVDTQRTRPISLPCLGVNHLLNPVISGQMVVWHEGPMDMDDEPGAIFARDLHTGVLRRVCSAAVRIGGIAISGDWIVWSELGEPLEATSDSDIVAYNLTTNEHRVVCDAPGDQRCPQLTGNWVVWQDARNSAPQTKPDDVTYDIYAYNLTTGQEQPVCTDAGDQGWLSVSN